MKLQGGQFLHSRYYHYFYGHFLDIQILSVGRPVRKLKYNIIIYLSKNKGSVGPVNQCRLISFLPPAETKKRVIHPKYVFESLFLFQTYSIMPMSRSISG